MRNYEKPIASFLAFYSEKDIASTQSIQDYAGTNANGSIPGFSGNTSVGGEIEEGVE